MTRTRARLELITILLVTGTLLVAGVVLLPQLMRRGAEVGARAQARPAPEPVKTVVDWTRMAMPPEPTPATDEAFADSPAAKFATGAAGIELPKARKFPGVSDQDVQQAMEWAKRLITASQLDLATVTGGAPEAFTAQLPEAQREWFAANLDNAQATAPDFDTRRWVFTLAPGSAVLATTVVKVEGEMRLKPFQLKSVRGVQIDLDYLFVYAVSPPGEPRTVRRLVDHSVGTLWAYRDKGTLTFWVNNLRRGGTSGARCDGTGWFVSPAFDGLAPDAKAGKPLKVDPYDRERLPDSPTVCLNTTGT